MRVIIVFTDTIINFRLDLLAQGSRMCLTRTQVVGDLHIMNNEHDIFYFSDRCFSPYGMIFTKLETQ